MQIVDKKLCCGCGACADVCPKNCIRMVYDEYGFLTPSIGADCVSCKLCQKTCPVLQPVNRAEIKAVYKGYHLEKEKGEDKESSSGALFPALAKKIIEDGGVVVGAIFEDEFKNVKHVVCTDMKEVENCRGSKYIQSKAQGIYVKTKDALKKGCKVLFSGTPCQIAGLKGYLKEDFDNLYTVDFICHGVASTAYWQAFLEKVSSSKKLVYVSFRNKEKGFTNSGIKVIAEEGEILVDSPIAQEPIFGKAFANNLVARDSCGTCIYAARGRVSDITLADNIIDCTNEEKKNGSSFIFINTKKGRELFDKTQENLCVEEKEIESVVSKMMHLNGSAVPHINRKKLLKAFQQGGVKKAKKYVTPYRIKRDCFIKKVLVKINRIFVK